MAAASMLRKFHWSRSWQGEFLLAVLRATTIPVCRPPWEIGWSAKKPWKFAGGVAMGPKTEITPGLWLPSRYLT
ncbi:MAG: hypothetical protein WBW41_08550 [Verrucomicrobiia bacterium]